MCMCCVIQLQWNCFDSHIIFAQDVQEQLSSQLEPFLVKQLEVKDGHMLLRVGKTEIEYNPSFRCEITWHLCIMLC